MMEILKKITIKVAIQQLNEMKIDQTFLDLATESLSAVTTIFCSKSSLNCYELQLTISLIC